MANIVIEIAGTNVTYFQIIDESHFKAIVKEKAAGTITREKAMARLYDASAPVAIANTSAVEYTVVADAQDEESSEESWVDLADQIVG